MVLRLTGDVMYYCTHALRALTDYCFSAGIAGGATVTVADVRASGG